MATRIPVAKRLGRIPQIPGYEILGELGRGGMGVVYKARQQRLNRIVALKMLLHPEDADPSDVIRFRSEAEAVATVEHPHIVQVHEFGLHEGSPYFTMEYLGGGTLHAHIKAEAPMPPLAAAKMIEKLARAVHAAHTQGIVHRDLKPGNVLFDSAGEPRVTDFGLAKRFSHQLTRTQAVMGTPGYMPPEQARGNAKSVGPGADIYALGVMLYECLAGELPFTGTDSISLLHKVIHDPPSSLRSKDSTTPRDIDLICLKCLEKDPNDRYPTAAAFAEDLSRFVSREPVSVRPTGPLERAFKWAKRRPAAASAYSLGVLALVLVCLFSGALALWRSAEHARADAVGSRELAEAAVQRSDIQSQELADAKRRLEAKNNNLTTVKGQLEKEQTKLKTANEELTKKNEEARIAVANLNAQKNLATRLAYFRDVNIASKELDEHNLLGAIHRLKRCPDPLRNWEWWHIYRDVHPETGSGISSQFPFDAAFDPATGVNVNTAVEGGSIIRYDFKTNRGVQQRFHPKGGVGAMKFSADGLRAITLGTNEAHPANPFELIAWNTADGSPIARWTIPVEYTTGHAISANGQRIVYVSSTGVARAFDVPTGKVLPPLNGVAAGALGLRLGETGTTALVPMEKELGVWELATGKILHRIPLPPAVVESTAVGPGDQLVAYGTAKGVLTIETLDGSKPIQIPKAHAGSISNIAFHAGRKLVATAGDDGAVRIWNLADGKLHREYVGHTRRVCGLNFNAKGEYLVSTAEDKTFLVWVVDGPKKKASFPYEPPVGGKGRMVLDTSGNRIFMMGTDRNAGLWPNETTAHALLAPEGQRIVAACFHPSKERIAFGTDRGLLYIWDYPGKPILVGNMQDAVQKVEYAADGVRLLTARPGMICVWDTVQGKLLRQWANHFENGNAALSPDGKWVATGHGDTLLGYSVNDERTFGRRIDDRIRTLGFTPDGTEFVVGTQNWRLLTYPMNKVDEPPTRELDGHITAIQSFAFSPNGKQIATGGQDGVIKVWDWETKEEVIGLKLDVKEPVIQIQFLPGKGLLAWTDGRTPILFDGSPVLMPISVGKDQILPLKK